jgi:hypothetical protein
MEPMRTALFRSIAGMAAVAFITAGLPVQARHGSQAPAGFPAAGSPSTVTLLSNGAEPRVPLRYKLKAGEKAQMSMTMAMGTTVSMGGAQMMAMELPTMKIGVDVDVQSVAANGDATYGVLFTSMTAEAAPGTDPAMAQMIQGAAGSITGTKGTAIISERGISREAKFSNPGADPALAQALSQVSNSLESMSMPFPAEPVGVGAQWEVRQSINSGGISVYQKTTAELVSVTASEVTLKLTVEQTAPAQAMENPAFGGMKVSIDSYKGSGTGTTTVRFASLVPTAEINSTASMTMSMEGGPGQLGTDMRIKTTIVPGAVK